MRKILTIIALTGCLISSFTASAQTVQASEVDYYPNEIGDNVIIRADSIWGGSLIYYTDATDRSYFIYRMPGNSVTTYKFHWPNHSSINNEKYIINDMETSREDCFFCGSKITRNLTGGFDTIGIVGRVNLHNIIGTPPSIDFDFCPISSIKEFTQMDIWGTSIIRISIVGLGHLSPLHYVPCAAFVEFQPQWNYNIVRIGVSDETLTDIAFSEDGNKVVSVSRLKNQPYKFVLRCDFASNLFVFTPIPGTTPPYFFRSRNVFNTSGLTLASSANTDPTWHEENVAIRIVGHNDPQHFTVAYECVDETNVCESKRMVAMFKIDVTYSPAGHLMSVADQQVVHGYLEDPETFVDMRYWFNTQDRFVLLHRSDNSHRNLSVLSFPLWGSYGQRPTLLADQELFQSVDCLYDCIVMGGKRLNDNTIIFSSQNTVYHETSCHMTKPHAFTEQLIGTPQFSNYSSTVIMHDRGNKTELLIPINMSSIPTQNNSCATFHIQ